MLGKLSGLYGVSTNEDAFNRLSRDKREALLLLQRRLTQVELWGFVDSIVNVYGVGGVGMYFNAAGDLESELDAGRTFTRMFARHRDNTGGFLEKGRSRASLHFLYIDAPQEKRDWHVHLDLYGPMGSVLSIAKHLRYEHWGTFRPDWQVMKKFVS
ncbi:MAG: hypothetical protein ABR607_03970 [Pyrinomonadaceae bacterium]